MILLIDDSLGARIRAGVNDYSYLFTERYRKYLHVYPNVTAHDLEELAEAIDKGVYDFVLYHRSLQAVERYSKERPIRSSAERFIEHVKDSINHIEFSGGFSRDESRAIEFPNDILHVMIMKDLFYTNLKSFLDGYIDQSTLHAEVLLNR